MPAANKFPKWMNEYLKVKEVEIVQIPDEYRIVEKKFPHIRIKSAKQLYEHIEREEAFWTRDVVQNNSAVRQYPAIIKKARDNFVNALEHEGVQNGMSLLQDAINNIRLCTINSTTELAIIFKKYSTEPESFFEGFRKAVADVPHAQQIMSQDKYLKGFILGLEYKKVISDLYSGMVGNEMTNFKNAANDAADKISEILRQSDDDYENHNQKHIELLEAKKEEYDSLRKEFDEFVSSCHADKEKLEKTYEAHMALAKPAEYWRKMKGSYRISGPCWLAGTVLVAIVAITMLTVIILDLEAIELFNLVEWDLDEWVGGIRTTAFITMLITIFMFIIRFTSKMATSSFHLARDAKERELLSGFYLALIKEGAVQDSERHLIISSLFSRADTGLLKGDSSPEMPLGLIPDRFTK
ncbi:MAG: DUF6161 domain-containing protein [Defluviitaleaceae bacterium]|nr:DUF6161 domain-containing protein [Defluviitaleaceae bacterium]